MRTLLYGRFGEFPLEIVSEVKNLGLDIITENPDLIITYGGDGTLIGSERDFPSVPKLPLKNSHACYRCIPLTPLQTLTLFQEDKLVLKEFLKIEASIGHIHLPALNDLIIRNEMPNVALRFTVTLDGTLPKKFDNLIGDGLVVATPFGSTGYYRSITKTSFTTGLGIAFNNLCTSSSIESYPASDLDTITVAISRGQALLAADNNPCLVNLTEGDEVKIKKSSSRAKIYCLVN